MVLELWIWNILHYVQLQLSGISIFAALFLTSDELWQDDWRPGFGGKGV